jgi:hypothetical protein
VSAHPDSDVKRRFQLDLHRPAREFHWPVAGGYGHVEVGPRLGDPDPLWLGYVRLHLVRRRPFGIARLERREPIGVHGRVRVRRIGVESLAEHEDAFLVRVAGRGREGDVSGQRHVVRDFLPEIVEVVRRPPDVLPAGGDSIGLRSPVKFGDARFRKDADVGTTFENPELGESRGGEEKW